MQEEARVVVGVPHVGDLPAYFVDSLCSVLAAPPHRFMLQRVERRPTDVARNEIVRSFLAIPGATHLFFMDSDMIFPREAVARLLSRGLPIVSGLYVARTELPVPHIYQHDHEDEKGHWYQADVRALGTWLLAHPEAHASNKAAVYRDCPASLVEADAVGAGCLLIRREVLEAMEPPWFAFNPGGYGGEDFYFCRRAAGLGYKPVVDLSVQCAHVTNNALGAIDFSDAFGVGKPHGIDLNQPIMVAPGPFGNEIIYAQRQDSEFRFPSDVEGYVSEQKGLFLYEMAKQTPPEHAVVELGVYKGRSLLCLAQGHEAIGVDHLAGEPAESLDMPSEAFSDHIAGSYGNELRRNVDGKATLISTRAADAGNAWSGPPVGLLVHDAGHDYGSVSADIEAWLPNLAPDAVLVFDDANFPGVHAAIADLGQHGWTFKNAAGSMLALQRTME